MEDVIELFFGELGNHFGKESDGRWVDNEALGSDLLEKIFRNFAGKLLIIDEIDLVWKYELAQVLGTHFL